MADSLSGNARGPKVVGGFIGLAGGVAMAAGSYLPWLTSFGESVTGWDLYDLRRERDELPFVIDEMFEPTFDPFFTGATTFVFGVLLAVLALAVLAVPERPLPARLRVGVGLYVAVAVVSITSLMAVAFNVTSVLTQPEGSDVGIAAGFWIVAAGGLAGFTGLLRASARSRVELRAGPTAPAPPVAPAGVAPGWHDDPYHRHQLRYWDGQAWTDHVSDQGAASEDRVLIG